MIQTYALITVFLLLLAGHALADYPLQGDWLSKAKNHRLQPIEGEVIWPMALFSHAMIHAVAVGLITQSLLLLFLELIAHMIIDYNKCAGRLSYNQDQVLHLLCKLAWVNILVNI